MANAVVIYSANYALFNADHTQYEATHLDLLKLDLFSAPFPESLQI